MMVKMQRHKARQEKESVKRKGCSARHTKWWEPSVYPQTALGRVVSHNILERNRMGRDACVAGDAVGDVPA